MRPRVLALLAIPAALAAAIAVRAARHVRSSGSSPDATSSLAGAADRANALSSSNPGSVEPPSSAGASPASPRRDGASGTPDDPSTLATSSSTASLAPGDHPRVTESSPTGVRIALDAPITVHFDRAPAAGSISLTIDPPAEGRTSWPDAQTLTFTPARWAEGKPYHVRVTDQGVETATLEFRTLFPPPDHIEPGRGERITLTFDDGADRPAQVTALLDLLEKEQIQAIFFPTGRWAEANPRLVERMTREGHRVCNHTYSHQNLRIPQLTEEEIRTEITRGAGDGTCRLFRPPLKAFDPRLERIVASMGYTLYLWDVDSRDWEGAPTEDIVNLVLAKAHPGAVVLFHMHAQASLDALPKIIPRLRKAGYVFRDPPDAGTP